MTFRRLTTAVVLGATVVALFPQCVFAQRRGEVVEEILRGFLEVQLEKDRRKAVERQELHDRQRNLPPQARPNPNAGVPIGVRNYRAKLGQISQQSVALTLTMQKSSVRVRGIQPLMNDALTIKTRAQLMYEKSNQVTDISLLREEYCDLDCEWRELAFRLQQLRGLDATTLAHTRQLTRYSDDMCDLLELEPQFDREAVFRLAVETCAHLESLVEDIEFELYDVRGSGVFVQECRGLAEQSRRVGAMVNHATYDELITKYSTFVSDWRTFAAKLYPHHNVQCDRSIRRIHFCNQQAFEQMWTPLAIDRRYLAYVSHAMTEEVNRLFENMTVKTLVQMPAAQQQSILQTARALYSQCEHYCECVDGDRPMNELLTDYVTIDRQWQTLDGYLQPINSRSVVVRRRLITGYGTELRHLLRVPAQLDREHALELAAALEEIAQHLRYDVRRYSRYLRSAAFRAQAFERSDAFYIQARNFHAQLQQGASFDEIQQGCDGMVTSWAAFSKTISSMPAAGLAQSRYQVMEDSRQELLPVMAELATILGL